MRWNLEAYLIKYREDKRMFEYLDGDILKVSILLLILLLFSLGAVYYALRESKRGKLALKESKPSSLQNIRLYTQDGTLLESMDGVYMVHWDINIYIIYEKEGEEFIKRVDKGDNMLLVATDVVDSK